MLHLSTGMDSKLPYNIRSRLESQGIFFSARNLSPEANDQYVTEADHQHPITSLESKGLIIFTLTLTTRVLHCRVAKLSIPKKQLIPTTLVDLGGSTSRTWTPVC